VKPENTEDILEIMNGHIYSAALGAAMELGLFWLLADKPLPASALAQHLDIPLNRCHYWLQILCRLDLLEEGNEGYTPTTNAREAILAKQDQDAWAFLVRENRDRWWYVQDLALNIGRPMSAWQAQDLEIVKYFQQIEEDPLYAARFTRMLYQIHTSFAEQLANLLDLRDARRLLDLGGGSGVVSFALLRKWDQMTSVVMDVESVCRTGREIAAENQLEDRITYLAGNFLNVDLPSGFDLVLLCDVSAFDQALFRRIHAVLNENGRFAIVDKFAQSRTCAPPSRLMWAFLHSLESPAQSVDYITAEMVQDQLQQAGFRDISASPVPHKDHLPWNIDWTLLEAYK
jgi:SAM-dependent methyltransferase